MVTKAELYLAALRELDNSTSDILTSSIVSHDGLTMASTGKDMVSKDAFAAYSAAAYRRSDDTMFELSGEKADMLIFVSENHRIFSARAGNSALIIVLTGKNADIGTVISELRKTASRVEALMK